MNNKGYQEVRSDFLFRIGKNMDSWYRVLGEFCEQTSLGTSAYSKTIKAAGYSDFRTMTIHYHPVTGWTAELN